MHKHLAYLAAAALFCLSSQAMAQTLIDPTSSTLDSDDSCPSDSLFDDLLAANGDDTTNAITIASILGHLTVIDDAQAQTTTVYKTVADAAKALEDMINKSKDAANNKLASAYPGSYVVLNKVGMNPNTGGTTTTAVGAGTVANAAMAVIYNYKKYNRLGKYCGTSANFTTKAITIDMTLDQNAIIKKIRADLGL